MKVLCLFSLIILASCASHRRPATVNGNPVAYDSMALGNVQASAVKRIEKQDVCFDVTLTMKNIKQEQANSSNWTLAWVDKNDQYHLIPLPQRQPASGPQGGPQITAYGYYNEWNNNFTTCVPQARMSDVKSLVLTPKELPYDKKDGMKLNWN